MSKIEEPNFHLMEPLLDKVAYPTSPIYQVAGIGAEGYTEFMREHVEIIIVHAPNSFIKLTLAWNTERGDFIYSFIATNMQNGSISKELELAKFYSLTNPVLPPNKDYFSWHNIGVKSLSFTDFAITANEGSLTILKEWLSVDSKVSNLQLYHFLRLLMLEFQYISSIEMRPTAQLAKEKFGILLSFTENSLEYHQTFVELLSEMHLLTNKWLMKANLIEVLQNSNTHLHLFYGVTPQAKLELDQLIEHIILIRWEEDMAEYAALDEAPQKDTWTSYFKHLIVTFDKLIRTQTEDEESIIIEWIVDEWENEELGYNIPLTHTLEPFTSMYYWETVIRETSYHAAHKAKYNPTKFPSENNIAFKKSRNFDTPPEDLEIAFNMNNTTWERLISVLDLKHINKNTLCDFFLVISGLHAFTDSVTNDTKGIRRYHCGEAGTEKLLAFIRNRLSHQGV